MDQTLLRQNATNVLNQALLTEFGLCVAIQSPGLISAATRGRQVLYRFKNESHAYTSLQIKLDPDNPETHLWIINGEKIVARPDNTRSEESGLNLDIDL